MLAACKPLILLGFARSFNDTPTTAKSIDTLERKVYQMANIKENKKNGKTVSYRSTTCFERAVHGGNDKPTTVAFYQHMANTITDYFSGAILQEISVPFSTCFTQCICCVLLVFRNPKENKSIIPNNDTLSCLIQASNVLGPIKAIP